jgi:hypothetical protein
MPKVVRQCLAEQQRRDDVKVVAEWFARQPKCSCCGGRKGCVVCAGTGLAKELVN